MDRWIDALHCFVITPPRRLLTQEWRLLHSKHRQVQYIRKKGPLQKRYLQLSLLRIRVWKSWPGSLLVKPLSSYLSAKLSAPRCSLARSLTHSTLRKGSWSDGRGSRGEMVLVGSLREFGSQDKGWNFREKSLFVQHSQEEKKPSSSRASVCTGSP